MGYKKQAKNDCVEYSTVGSEVEEMFYFSE